MMIGVAQVIGTKPMFRSVFSGLPSVSSSAAFALSIGKTDASAAAAAPPPTRPMKERRLISECPKTERTIALSIARSIISSLDCKLLSSRMPEDDAQAEHPHLAPCLRSALLEKGSFRLLTVIGVSCANS
jgi:hypothetical protein